MHRPERLLLHIGHGKTGSSFLQSALALSTGALRDAGIAYPIDPEVAARARAGGITAGNFRPAPRLFRDLIQNGWDGPQDQLLLSSEALFRMGSKDMPRKMRRQLPDTRIEVLLFIRDPLDHAVSNYQQMVKRGGFTGDFASFLADYTLPEALDEAMAPLLEAGFHLTVRNYSRHRARVLAVAEDWLGLTPGSLTPPTDTVVNRSMTNAEIALQKAFNRHLPRGAGALISDPLCENLPGIASERPPVDPQALARFLDRMRAVMASGMLDRLVPAAEMYHVPEPDEVLASFPQPETEPRYAFSQAQLDVVATAICAALAARGPTADPVPQGTSE